MFAKALSVIAATCALAAPLHAQDASTVPSETAPATETRTPAMRAITADMIKHADIVSLQGQYSDDIWNDTAPLRAMVADLTEIGEVEEIILTPEGRVEGLTTDVGGFLGLGQKRVLIPLDDIRLVQEPDSDDITVITRMSDEALQDAPEYDLTN